MPARLAEAEPEAREVPIWEGSLKGIHHNASEVALQWKERDPMSHWQPAAYKEYQWIVADPRLLGGKLAIRGTRLAVSLILECLASGMSLDDIDQSFDCDFPPQALPEVLKVASEFTDSFHVAA